MFCAHCGKPMVQDGQFCAHCGKSVASATRSPASTSNEWEYTYYRVSWEIGKGGRFPLTFGQTEYGIRLDNWGKDQSWVLPEVQKYLDKGWLPLSEVGPGGYFFIHHEDYNTWLEISQFLVEFRRRATPLSASAKKLLGIWEETKDTNTSPWSKLGNALLGQRLEIQKWRYEFYENRRFIHMSPNGTKVNGVYTSGKANEFILQFEFGSQDYLATLQGNRLICTAKGYKTREFERIDN